MAFLAAAIPYITAATAVYGAVQARNSGIAQQQQLDAQSRTEADAAKGREIQRRQDLLRALSAQNAAAAAAGVETSGSIGGIMRTDIKQNQQDLLTDAAGISSRVAALRAAGQNARTSANTQATMDLFSGAVDTAKAWKGIK